MAMRHAPRARRPGPRHALQPASSTALIMLGASRTLISATRNPIVPTSQASPPQGAVAAPRGQGYLLTEPGSATFPCPASVSIGTGDFTVFAHIHVFATSGGYAYIIGTSGNYFSLSINHPNASGNIGLLIGGLVTKNSGISCATPGDYRIVAVRRSGQLRFFVNGADSGDIASTESGDSFSSIVLNSYLPGSSYGATNTAFYSGGIDSRGWSDGEIAAYIADPRTSFRQVITHTALDIPVAGTDGTITLDEIAQYRVFNGASGSASVTISGSHTGTTDTIQVQIEDLSTGVIVPWQTLQASVAAGAFSGSVTVPRGGWYLARVRKLNATATTDVQVQQWGVGLIVGGMGQSQIGIWNNGGTYGGTPDSRAVIHNGTSWSQMTTSGKYRNTFAAQLIAAANCPVAVIVSHIDGSGIESWYDSATGKTANYTAWESKVTAAGSGLSAMIWWQGEGDVAGARTKAQYLIDLNALLAQLRTDYGASLPVILPQLGRTTYPPYTDAMVEQIRDAQVEASRASANNYGITTIEFGIDDDVHYGDAGQLAIAARLAQCIAFAFGAAAYARSPRISAATRIGPTTIDVTLSHAGGTDFTPTTGITGFSVLDGGTPVTISSAARQTASTVRLTLASTPAGAVTVRYGYGANPTVSGILRDNTGLALALETTDADVSAQGRKVLLNCIQRVGGAAAASVTGLQWAFFDAPLPNNFAAPSVKGTAESTDASGVLEIDVVGTTLNVGDVGFLVVSDTDGTLADSRGFAGPVQVSG